MLPTSRPACRQSTSLSSTISISAKVRSMRDVRVTPSTSFVHLMCSPDSVTPPLVHPDISCVLFPPLPFHTGLYLSRLLPGSRSFPLVQRRLLDIPMPVEPRLLAVKAESISLSTQCLCSNVLQTPPAKIFTLHSWKRLRAIHGIIKNDTADCCVQPEIKT